MTFAIKGGGPRLTFLTPKQVFLVFKRCLKPFLVYFYNGKWKKVQLGREGGGATLNGKSHQKFPRLF